jgi:hypothetical protein
MRLFVMLSTLSTLAFSLGGACHRVKRIVSPNNQPAGPPPAGLVSDAAAPAPVAGAPFVAYTDLVAGPTSGGEKNKGAFLSIFGANLGTVTTTKVFIGGAEVDSYRALGPARGRADLQQLTVQVGALGQPTPGRPLPIKVVVGGVASNTNHTFTPQPGDTLFVSTTGNDKTAVKNDDAHPWRFLQTPDQGGALGAAKPGDVVVIRGGSGIVWSDLGWDKHWARFRNVTGNAPSGEKGHGYVAIMSYPGEDVRYVPPPDAKGGIHGIGEDYPELSDWIVISGLHIESRAEASSDAAPVNLHAHSDHWRVVNNDLGPWPAPNDAGFKAGGVAGNGKTIAILGNAIHDIGGGKENHGIYLDSGSTDVEVAFNTIRDVTGGNLIQSFDNIGGQPLERISVHHNLLLRGGRYGLNISGGTHTYRAWNNVIADTAMAGVRFAMDSDKSTYLAIVFNTIYGANATSPATPAPIVNDETFNAGTALISYNVVAGSPELQSRSYLLTGSQGDALHVERNLWFGIGSPPSDDLDPIYDEGRRDPRFVDVGKRDLRIGAGSAAIGQAVAGKPFPVLDDFALKPRPPKPSAGAFEP